MYKQQSLVVGLAVVFSTSCHSPVHFCCPSDGKHIGPFASLSRWTSPGPSRCTVRTCPHTLQAQHQTNCQQLPQQRRLGHQGRRQETTERQREMSTGLTYFSAASTRVDLALATVRYPCRAADEAVRHHYKTTTT